MEQVVMPCAGLCETCGKLLKEGEKVNYDPKRGLWHLSCLTPPERPAYDDLVSEALFSGKVIPPRWMRGATKK